MPAMSDVPVESLDHRALDRIEQSILPNIALTLDALLEAAAQSVPGDDAVRSAELNAIAAQLAATIRQLEAVMGPAQPRLEWPLRMSA